MNWATIEPETRLYKGKDLFRWDDTPGLVLAANQALEDGEDLPNDTVEGCTVPGGKKLDEMTPRQRRIHTYAWRKEGSQTRKYNPSILNKSNSIYCGVDPEIFVRLRIEVVNPAVNSKIRKELVAKLVAAIKEDLDIQTREDGESEMRKEGFYRWAGKTALQHMERTREGIDWATGQKITAKAEEMLDIDTPRRETFTKQLSCDSLAVKKYLSAGKVPALPSISVKTPVWTKTLRITISPASLDAVDDTPTKRKPERPPLPTAPGTTFILQGCTGPHGKRITYSKMLQSNNGSYGVIDNKENIFPDTWKPANVPAEGFFEHNENNDDEGWSIVGSGKRRNGSVQI
ncbi:hypothetical protein M7I_2427 [Glarea lozoyensis 74030]|uniref:Uncharacterized protein n=1 Tax=Glarea lozoyensis (strain ATCC 74030 / MF5533) TaxID=1104152 RepID=H0EIR2_GLAL7|nr:hypothetical protein M7I_2427 [Glarea lozoyensis 74030]